ncbi:MAG: bifunctional riboflavin kinase/FAD synthetase [Nitrospirae bacterium]|nr:MAG: bifunctional riboflavin kinase/FAD synthetase [Nitrospirota bacterium]
MRISHGLPTPPPLHPVATIGNFDGQHLGHQALIKAVVDLAQRRNGTATVITFDPHPAAVLAPETPLRFLASQEEKFEFFKNLGVQEVVVLAFTRSLAALSPEDFVREVLVEGLRVRDLLVGANFVFGKDRRGTVDDLVRLGKIYGFEVHPLTPILLDGEVVSSTRVRHLIQQGNMKDAARCLGRPYRLSGHVVQGEGRGAALGCPTANIRIPGDRVVPPDGVYVTTTDVHGHEVPSVSYIGQRPTFGGGERMLEVHLFAPPESSLYDQQLRVNFLERLRGDQQFDSVDALRIQIQRDLEAATDVHARRV